ncbi:MAG: hypothetical protein M1838_000124 [Thelocarpon superellum]|nr:MAG: hypothetical protein M1838_000124 [Thelocarpon superellum]
MQLHSLLSTLTVVASAASVYADSGYGGSGYGGSGYGGSAGYASGSSSSSSSSTSCTSMAAEASPGSLGMGAVDAVSNPSSSSSSAPALVDAVVVQMSAGGSSMSQEMTPSAPPGKTHVITVGGSAGLVYTPDSIQADVNDLVQFNFMSKNHTVTQSAFDKPCVKAGSDSGFMPNDGTVNPPPSYTIQVTTTSPMWFYCKQKEGTHCGKGMVFSINPTAQKTQALFKQMAIQQNGTADAGAANAVANASPPSSSGSQIVSGTGSSSGGSCQCMCLCGAASWPQGTGMNAYGGYGGKRRHPPAEAAVHGPELTNDAGQMPASWGSMGSAQPSGYSPPAIGAPPPSSATTAGSSGYGYR